MIHTFNSRKLNNVEKDKKENVVKIWLKIATHLSVNISAYALRARFIFSIGKNIAALSELISQMVKYLHASSHVKPQRVKMHMQMRAGRKGHKKIQRGSVTTSFFALLCFCDGLLIRGETELSLKRQGEEDY